MTVTDLITQLLSLTPEQRQLQVLTPHSGLLSSITRVEEYQIIKGGRAILLMGPCLDPNKYGIGPPPRPASDGG